jgi:tRNA-binding EMAP/Myf-like protein
VIVVHSGAVVGRALLVTPHPNGQKIWLAWVDVGDGDPVQIVFGGKHMVERGDLVPVAPPGVRAVVLDNLDGKRRRTMRRRRYRGQPSHGMFCSLAELGWYMGGPDEVAILQYLPVGFRLDDVPANRRPNVVKRPLSFHCWETSDTFEMKDLADHVRRFGQVQRGQAEAPGDRPHCPGSRNTGTLTDGTHRSGSHEVDRLVARR